jgi:hypothetical protein
MTDDAQNRAARSIIITGKKKPGVRNTVAESFNGYL